LTKTVDKIKMILQVENLFNTLTYNFMISNTGNRCISILLSLLRYCLLKEKCNANERLYRLDQSLLHPFHRISENVASKRGIEPETSCTAGEYSMKRAIRTAVFTVVAIRDLTCVATRRL
jgi:hypothetical protein